MFVWECVSCVNNIAVDNVVVTNAMHCCDGGIVDGFLSALGVWGLVVVHDLFLEDETCSAFEFFLLAIGEGSFQA